MANALVPGESPPDTYFAQRPEELFTRQHETLALNLSNERVSYLHFTCDVHETGKGETGFQLDVLGEQIAKIQELRDEEKLQRAEFYCADPHIEVSLRNTGECNYQLICGNANQPTRASISDQSGHQGNEGLEETAKT